MSACSISLVMMLQYVPCKNERDFKVCRRCDTPLPSAIKKRALDF